jgi:hypothetical protein
MGPSILVVVGLGIWLVVLEEDIAFSQLWIWLSLVLVVVPRSGHLLRLQGQADFAPRRRARAENGQVRLGLNRLLWLARIDILVLVAVLGLMVFKPGGPSA